MSVRLEIVRDVTARFQLAAENVAEQPGYALPKGTLSGFVVRLDGSEEEDGEQAMATDARLLPVAVTAHARTLDEIAALADAADTVFAGLLRDGRLSTYPRPTFGTAGEGGEAETPVLNATWVVPIRYRVSVLDPTVEA